MGHLRCAGGHIRDFEYLSNLDLGGVAETVCLLKLAYAHTIFQPDPIEVVTTQNGIALCPTGRCAAGDGRSRWVRRHVQARVGDEFA